MSAPSADFLRVLTDHLERPRGAGDLPGADAAVEVENPVCGDLLRLAVALDGGRVRAARFRCSGCAASAAAGSAAVLLLEGASVEEARAVDAAQVAAALGGLPAGSRHAADLAADAVRAVFAALDSPPAGGSP